MEAPDRFPAKKVEKEMPEHGVKKGGMRAFATYNIHEPEQNANGDWASISIGGQYYLFADNDPAGSHGREDMSVAWFTSGDISKPFTFCGSIGKGHPDPEIIFAEGKFFLLTQLESDFVSPGPWVEKVEARIGVDTNNDGGVDHWSEWTRVTEKYEVMKGFAKQVSRIPASMDLKGLPEAYGFQFEVKVEDQTGNLSRPSIEKVELEFE